MKAGTPLSRTLESHRLKMSAKILILCLVYTISLVHGQRFKVVLEWNYINFTWNNEEDYKSAITTRKYIPENNLLSGIKYYDGYFYLTLPRMKDGVPVTLARISSNTKDTEPLLEPYPCWDMNTEGDCHALQNVQNVEIDTAGRIWILDGGKTSTLTREPVSKCPARLLIFDISTDLAIINYVFPETITNNGNFLYDLVIDDVDGGYAYITDNSGTDPGIIVYSMKQNRAWKVRDEASMRASHDAVEFRVNGTAVSAPINIAGIALGPRTMGNGDEVFVSKDRIVYYSPLSSYELFSISSAVLRDERTTDISSKVKRLGKKASQSDGMVMDEMGTLYYGLLADNSVAKWDSKVPFTSGQRVIARDSTYIQWPDSIAFDMSGNLLVVTNRLQKFIYGTLNLNEANFRILESNVGVKSYLYGIPVESTKDQTEVDPPLLSTHSGQTGFNQSNRFYNPQAREHDNNNMISNAPRVNINLVVLFVLFSLVLLK